MFQNCSLFKNSYFFQQFQGWDRSSASEQRYGLSGRVDNYYDNQGQREQYGSNFETYPAPNSALGPKDQNGERCIPKCFAEKGNRVRPQSIHINKVNFVYENYLH